MNYQFLFSKISEIAITTIGKSPPKNFSTVFFLFLTRTKMWIEMFFIKFEFEGKIENVRGNAR